MAIVPAEIMLGLHRQICGCPAQGSFCKLVVELSGVQDADGDWQRCDLQFARNLGRSQPVDARETMGKASEQKQTC